MEPNVFCVGMNKTGLTSMVAAFEELGIGPVARSTSSATMMGLFNQIIMDDDYLPSLRVAKQFTAFADRPWNAWGMYRLLDRAFPGSKFILTVRDPESWWQSVKHWVTVEKPYMQQCYRVHLRAPRFSKSALIRGYRLYNARVASHFNGADDFLRMNIIDGDGWDKLCPFLDRPRPSTPFPHLNRQPHQVG